MNIEAEIAHGPASGVDSSEMDGKYLTFYIDQQLFGMPIAEVVQIIGIREITALPESAPYIKGIIQLRDSVIPVIDIRIRFGREERPYDEKTCIIVSTIQNKVVGLIVDEVDAVTNINAEAISLPPQVGGHLSANAYLTGIARLDENAVLILDCSEIMPKEEFERL